MKSSYEQPNIEVQVLSTENITAVEGTTGTVSSGGVE